ncbi:MAG: hypothetical protein ACFBSE_24075 [Prochloraceae cyanobacterium]
MEEITKNQLIKIITDWGNKKITSQELRQWMECNYLPLHRDIGLNEPLHTQKAMHGIMNAFDHFFPENIIPEQYHTAIQFLKTSEEKYEENESKFFESCFISKPEDKNSKPKETLKD